jgi:ATP adenylyltransferase
MIVPNRHVDCIDLLTDEEKLDWLSLYEEIRRALQKALRPHGFNAGMNLGAVAGAGVPSHLHLHLVPRWQGDSNFMPVLGATKVISESMQSVYQGMSKILRHSGKRKAGKKK